MFVNVFPVLLVIEAWQLTILAQRLNPDISVEVAVEDDTVAEQPVK